MSDIKAGDLVMITKASTCCGSKSAIGETFILEELVLVDDGFCIHCFARRPVLAARAKGRMQTDSARLIKINPPSQEDEITTNREEAVNE